MYQKLNSDENSEEDNRFKTIAKNRKILQVQKHVLDKFLDIYKNHYKKEYQYAYQRFGIMQNQFEHDVKRFEERSKGLRQSFDQHDHTLPEGGVRTKQFHRGDSTREG